MKEVEIYTDGACSGNPGPGGWGAVLSYRGVEKEISGYAPDTTNQRMELTAALEALTLLKESCQVRLFSDSAYLIRAFTEHWLEKWDKTGWINSKKEPVANEDLWRALWRENQRHQIEWIKVKGHSDNEKNNRCDALARAEIKTRQG